MAMGPEDAAAFAEAHALPAIFLLRLPDGGFEERRSQAFEARETGASGPRGTS